MKLGERNFGSSCGFTILRLSALFPVPCALPQGHPRPFDRVINMCGLLLFAPLVLIFLGFRVFGEGRQKRKTVGRDLEEECSEFRVVGLGPTLRALALGVWSFRLTESLLPWFSDV